MSRERVGGRIFPEHEPQLVNTRTPQVLMAEAGSAWALSGVYADEKYPAVMLQIVRVGIGADIPFEGQQFCCMSVHNARHLAEALQAAADEICDRGTGSSDNALANEPAERGGT
jgi:hypothetical protein